MVEMRPYKGEFTTRSRFPASTASVSTIPASSPNETSSSARLASKRVSTAENGGSLSRAVRILSRTSFPLFDRGEARVSKDMPMQVLSDGLDEALNQPHVPLERPESLGISHPRISRVDCHAQRLPFMHVR